MTWERAAGMLALGLLAIGRPSGALDPRGVRCGEKRCSGSEYCSPYDKHCKPCSSICDEADRNYQPDECAADCQEYLRDARYVLRQHYDDLRGEIAKLWIAVAISIAVALLSLLSTAYPVASRLAGWEKTRAAARRAFAGKSSKGSTDRGAAPGTTGAIDHRHRKAQGDAELGVPRNGGGGLKLTMPTISASVAPSRLSEAALGNGGGSGSGSGSGGGNATPNTSSTSLSRRHPSEDTTLDYAYDNPAMTPSPESVQLRTKRESSF